MNATNDPQSPIPTNVRIALEGFVQSFRKPFWRFQPSELGYQARCKKAVRFLRDVARGVIKQRQENKKKGEDGRNDILSHILKLQERDNRTTIEDMIDHFITFVVGGKYIFASYARPK